MQKRPRIIVFSDLDGTLLDHATYRWDSAAGVVARVLGAGHGLVLATSKTAAEVVVIRAELGAAAWPAIVENGGGILAPGASAQTDHSVYHRIRDAIPQLPPGFVGFGDMTVAEVAEATGLSRQAAEGAKARCFSEPGTWTGSAKELDFFLAALNTFGLVAQRGGRFLTLSFGRTKADRMAEITALYQPDRTIALGDAPNDVAMLEQADHGVIVANPGGKTIPPLVGEETGQIQRTLMHGPAGWSAALGNLLDALDSS